MTQTLPRSFVSSLIYAVPADLGSGAAHCVHVVKMGMALRRVGLAVDVCVAATPSDDVLMADFGLTDPLTATQIRPVGRGPASLRFARGVMNHAQRGQDILTRNLLTAWLSVVSGHRTVLELHSPIETLKGRIMFRLFMHHRRALGLVTITQALKDRYVSDFGTAMAPRIHVLPDAADPVVHDDPASADTMAGPPTVGYVGSFLPGKGAEQVLRIATLMPDVHFVLVGGPNKAIANQTVPANVHLTGELPHAAAMQLMASFVVALLPNQARVIVSGGTVDIGRWTSPLKLFEYMAAGRPIVASRLPVLEEVLADGLNALLVDPSAPDDWAVQIRRLIDDPMLAQQLAMTAHRDFVQKYSWTARAMRMAEIFSLRVAS